MSFNRSRTKNWASANMNPLLKIDHLKEKSKAMYITLVLFVVHLGRSLTPMIIIIIIIIIIIAIKIIILLSGNIIKERNINHSTITIDKVIVSLHSMTNAKFHDYKPLSFLHPCTEWRRRIPSSTEIHLFFCTR